MYLRGYKPTTFYRGRGSYPCKLVGIAQAIENSKGGKMDVDKIVRRGLTGFALAGLLSVGAWAQSQTGSGSTTGSNPSSGDVKQDTKDLRKDKNDVRKERREVP